MKIKLEIEIDTESEQDLNTIEEVIEKLQDLAEIISYNTSTETN